jgi:2-succinyl-6-hydroxy-2,4-cyclohexadiene-1-carboxylate synthase
LALSFAMAHPDRVDHLVLESASPGIEAPDAREQRTQLDQARAEKLIEQGLPEFLENWYQMPLFESLRKKGLVSELIKSRSMGDPVWLARTIEAFSPGRQRSNWSRLAELATPTLLLTGALDPAYQAAMARADRLLPNSQHRSIALAGHNIHLEQPDLFSDAILAFLKGCRRAEN